MTDNKKNGSITCPIIRKQNYMHNPLHYTPNNVNTYPIIIEQLDYMPDNRTTELYAQFCKLYIQHALQIIPVIM